MSKGITVDEALRVFGRESGCSSSSEARDILLDDIHAGLEFILFNGGGDLLREWIVTVRTGLFTFPRDMETPIKYKIGCKADEGFGTVRSSYYPYSSQSVSNCCDYKDWGLDISIRANNVYTEYPLPEKGVRLLATTRDDRDVGKKIMVMGKRGGKQLQPTHNGYKTAGEILTIYKEDDPNKKYGAWVFDEVTGVVKDPTCAYTMLTGYDDSTGDFTFLSHYMPDEEVPTYKQGQLFSCPYTMCDFSLHILGRIAPGVRYCRDEDILPISSLEMLRLLAKRARYDATGDFKNVEIVEDRLKDLIKKQVAYQQAASKQISFNLESSGAALTNF